MKRQQLFEKAVEAAKNAYTPYSKFNVGAAIQLKSGRIITGANIENASFGLTNCAERSALFSAYSEGIRKNDIEAILVTGNTKNPISPCGACRQVMRELLHPDTLVILTNFEGFEKEVTVSDLLPYAFTDEDLSHDE